MRQGQTGYMSGIPRSGAWQDLATEVTEITEGGGLIFYALCALCAAVAQSGSWCAGHIGRSQRFRDRAIMIVGVGIKLRLGKMLTALSHLPRAIALVWGATRSWTAAWATLLLIQGLLPAATVYWWPAAVITRSRGKRK